MIPSLQRSISVKYLSPTKFPKASFIDGIGSASNIVMSLSVLKSIQKRQVLLTVDISRYCNVLWLAN